MKGDSINKPSSQKSSESRGRFITIEGQDGAGKSTNISVIHDYLEQNGIAFVQSREPGGTVFGERIRELLLSSDDNFIGDMAELLLVFAARAQHITEVIEPALADGVWVLCDRFTDATYAYQGAGRGISMTDIQTLEQTVQGQLRPDLTIVLDVPVEVGESRAGQRSSPDRFELQKLEFKQKVRDCYISRVKQMPERMRVVDASQSLEDVKQAIVAELSQFCGPYLNG